MVFMPRPSLKVLVRLIIPRLRPRGLIHRQRHALDVREHRMESATARYRAGIVEEVGRLVCACLLLCAGACGAVAVKPTAGPPPLSSAQPATAAPTSPASILSASLVLTGHTDFVTQLTWSPDGSLLASSAGRFDEHNNADLAIRLLHPDGTLV